MEGSVFSPSKHDCCLESCASGKISDTENPPPTSSPPLDGKRVRFLRTQIYYFLRQQGNSSVPQRGGCSLGMAQTHFHSEIYGVQQYRRMRRLERELNLDTYAGSTQLYSRGRRRKLNYNRMPLTPVEDSINPGDARRVPVFFSPPKLSPQTDDRNDLDIFSSLAEDTPPPPCLSPPNEPFGCELNIDPDLANFLEADSETSMDSSLPKVSEKKLLPIQPTVRSRMLKQAGVVNIDESERWTCASLRNSRASVGCGCITSLCNSEACSCALAGVPCQVDRPGFPCNCNSEHCRNPNGRVEFSASRVRAHARHVLQRLSTSSGTDQPELSSEHGECLWCLRERRASPPLRPLASLLSHPSPPSEFSQATSVASASTSPSISKSIVLYTPPIIPPFCTALTRAESPGPLLAIAQSDNQVDSVDSAADECDDDSEDTILLGKAVFPPATATPSPLSLASGGTREEPIQDLSSKAEMTPFGRLSLRKRRIIRSPFPCPTIRKRYALTKSRSLLFSPPRLRSLVEVDSPIRWSHQSSPSAPEEVAPSETVSGAVDERGVV
ncbi:Cysteine/serine-rich nuclear protein 2 [Taenia crassiceps]|uniref:Cysteine/serine-rich nuclear protein 2 n=1 Tax=Taenia crassiceps TaxID=6207 RepID=A0ABR4Q7Q2_9CEST